MTISCVWNVVQLDRNTADDKVVSVHYTVSATDGTNAASAYGSVGVDGDVAVPYSKISKELAFRWMKAGLGEEGIAKVEAALQAQLDEQANPTTKVGLPKWSNKKSPAASRGFNPKA
jgi:hypothetical protein